MAILDFIDVKNVTEGRGGNGREGGKGRRDMCGGPGSVFYVDCPFVARQYVICKQDN